MHTACYAGPALYLAMQQTLRSALLERNGPTYLTGTEQLRIVLDFGKYLSCSMRNGHSINDHLSCITSLFGSCGCVIGKFSTIDDR